MYRRAADYVDRILVEYLAARGSGADGPHDGLFPHAGVCGVWPAAHRGRSAGCCLPLNIWK